MRTTHCALHTAHYTLHTAHCTQHCVRCTVQCWGAARNRLERLQCRRRELGTLGRMWWCKQWPVVQGSPSSAGLRKSGHGGGARRKIMWQLLKPRETGFLLPVAWRKPEVLRQWQMKVDSDPCHSWVTRRPTRVAPEWWRWCETSDEMTGRFVELVSGFDQVVPQCGRAKNISPTMVSKAGRSCSMLNTDFLKLENIREKFSLKTYVWINFFFYCWYFGNFFKPQEK